MKTSVYIQICPATITAKTKHQKNAEWAFNLPATSKESSRRMANSIQISSFYTSAGRAFRYWLQVRVCILLLQVIKFALLPLISQIQSYRNNRIPIPLPNSCLKFVPYLRTLRVLYNAFKPHTTYILIIFPRY